MEQYNNDTRFTSLYGSVQVKKDHPHIQFRGCLDSLMADFCYGEALALVENRPKLSRRLAECVACLQAVMSSHVLNTELRLPAVDGVSLDVWHDMSHHTKSLFGTSFFLPTAEDGLLLAWLNILRTHTREAERVAVASDEAADIIRALNWLSGAIYVFMCEEKADKQC